MPLRLIIFFAAVSAGVFYLALLNPGAVEVTFFPGFSTPFPVYVIALFSFTLGAVSIFLLYFYDTLTELGARFRERSKKRNEEKVAALYASAREKLALGLDKDAEKLVNKVLANDPGHVDGLIMAGVMARKEGAYSRAVTLHSKARGLDSANVEALLELGEDYVAAEQYANAVSTLLDARDIAGRSYPLHVRIRDIFVAVKNWPEALSAQRKVIDAASWDAEKKEQKMLAALLYENGSWQFGEGKIDDARALFRSALRSDPEFVPAYLRLAEADELAGWEKEAVATLEKGFKATGSLTILKYLEAYLVSKGAPDRAAAELRWARDQAPGEPMIRLFLAGASLLAGDFASARNEIGHINGRLSQTTLYHLVEGNTRAAENNVDLALQSLKEAYRTEMAAVFLFRCHSCHHTRRDYSGRCDECGAWNSYTPSLT